MYNLSYSFLDYLVSEVAKNEVNAFKPKMQASLMHLMYIPSPFLDHSHQLEQLNVLDLFNKKNS